MLKLISPQDMLACEKHYFETSGIPSIDVMERAAAALSGTALARFPEAKKVFIACGPGGNGGDGYACARLLREKGRDCRLFAASEAKSPDAVENARRAQACGMEIADFPPESEIPDLWIDCLYGTGLSRAPGDASAALIRRMNADRERGAAIIACDIPSGLNGCTGAAYDPCVQADITVSFQLGKYGHFLQDGLDMCGEVIIADVGFPSSIFPENTPSLLLPEDIKPLFTPRKRNIHKGSCGHLLIIAGSFGMAGAAALCARAALRSGAGLVSIACPESIVPILQTLAPCAMCIPLPEKGASSVIREALAGKGAVAVGPGVGRGADPEIIRAALGCSLPAAIDADALNIIAASDELKSLLGPMHVITPHPGEAARLLGRKCADPIADARELARTGAAVILKGASRVICNSNETCISASGGCGMARGGSGDILTGILGALLAENSARTPLQSAAAACEIHGLAGEAAQRKYGPRAMNSADMLEFLPEVFNAYAP